MKETLASRCFSKVGVGWNCIIKAVAPPRPFCFSLRQAGNRLLAVSTLVLLSTFTLFGQQGGTILGTVTDASGAIVPGVQITITDTDTNQSTKVVSGSRGDYVAPDLQIGHYVLRAEPAGFKSIEQKDIVLNVGDRERIDIKLEIGSTQETVTVEANAVAVQSESGEVSDVITGQQVTQLATNGRSIYSLAALTAGASSNQSDLNIPTSAGGDAGVSFNGLRENHNLWVIDGGEASDRGGAGGSDVMPSIDAVAEFRAQTSNYSSEYGLSSAGTMTLAIRSGTKNFHASAWEFNRNDALDAGNYVNKASGVATPELRFNTYGFNVGGPVFIPKVYNTHRDKTFFFYNMEWRKLIQGGNVKTSVPLSSEYGGNFGSTPLTVPSASQLSPSLLAKFASYGLTPGQSFSQIPVGLLDPNAQVLLKTGIFPAPNGSGNQFVGGNKLPTNVREEIIRVDHRFSDKVSIFGHYITETVSQTYGTSQWSGDNVPTVGTTFSNPGYHAVVHATFSLTPSILNEVAYNQNGNTLTLTPNGIYARPTGLNIPELFQGNNLNRIPQINLSQTGTNYDVNSWPWHNKADDYQVRDDLSWIKGSHQIKMGASWALYKKSQDLFGNTQGGFTFNGQYTGNDFADYLLGLSSSYTELAVQDKGYWDNMSPAAYIQDNWKVNSHLTLNLGLRWDGIPHTYEENNRMSNFYPGNYNYANAPIFADAAGNSISPLSRGLGTSPNPILAGQQFYLNGIGVAGKNGVPNGLVKDQWLNFGPRIGFAYSLGSSGKTVLRGGFGIMYERVQGNDMYNAGPNQPFSASVTFKNVSLSNPNLSLQSGTTLVAPIPVGSITGLAYTDYKSPSSYQYSAGVQRQISEGSVVSISYVGNQNRHQNDYRETNLPNQSVLPCLIQALTSCPYNTQVPYLGYQSIRLSENAQNSHYNSLQIELHARIRKDLTLQSAYTLSRAIDPATGNGNLGGDLANVSNPYNRAYDNGPSGGDRTHIAFVNFIYDLPFLKNSQNHLLKTALGGWELSGIGTLESGLPLTLSINGSQSSNGLQNASNRPNVNGNINYPNSYTSWFNTSSFSLPALGAWGNLGKGSLRGPGRDNWNISAFKNFSISESYGSYFQLRVETFNTLNHTQFNGIGTALGSSQFGQVTSVWDPRVFQLGAKLIF